MTRHLPAVVVGAGPAGLAAAMTLARAGLPHLVIERSATTGDALCGGFVSWRTIETLSRLGLEADDLNRTRVRTLRLFAAGRMSAGELDRPALAVSRRRLDSLLLTAAEAAGCAVERGVVARSVGETVRLTDGGEISAGAVFLACGKHDVRGAAQRSPALSADPALGLRLRLPASAALARMVGQAIEMHLFDRGYAGIVLQEDGSANLCMAVRQSRLRECSTPKALLRVLGDENPALADRLAHAAPLEGASVDAVARVPYGWSESVGAAGLFRLGDQAAVIDSLAGEGIGIALASGLSAAHAYAGGGPLAARQWQGHFARRVASALGAAATVRTIAASAPGRRVLGLALTLWPGALRHLSALTRVPATREPGRRGTDNSVIHSGPLIRNQSAPDRLALHDRQIPIPAPARSDAQDRRP